MYLQFRKGFLFLLILQKKMHAEAKSFEFNEKLTDVQIIMSYINRKLI